MTIKELEGYKERAAAIVDESGCPGLSIAIVKDGEVVFAEGFGLRNVEDNLPATAETIYAIGSCSKAFTSMASALMVDEGKLEWDRPVVRYLPDFRLYDAVVTERLTPRDLLTHRSGMDRHEFAWYGSPLTREELIERMRYLELSKELRQVFQYNNLNYMLAGYLAGKLAGKTWEELVRERIFIPLGMQRSNLSVQESQKDANHAVPYQKIDGTVTRIPFRNIDAVGPAGSINSSVLEMANWLKLHLNKGKFGDKQILSEAVFNEMHAPQIVSEGTIADLAREHTFNWNYAMGWWTVAYRGHELWLHEGGIDGFTAFTYLFPRLGIGAVVLSNLNTHYGGASVVLEAMDRMAGLEFIDWNSHINETMAKVMQAAAEGKQKQADEAARSPFTHELGAYTGTYHHPGYGDFKVFQDGTDLKAHFLQADLPLRHIGYDIFQFSIPSADMEFKLRFNMDFKGNIASLSIPFQAGIQEIVFERVADEKLKERSFLEQFAGEYELMGMRLSISVRGDCLQAVLPGQPVLELVPYQETTFNAKGLPISVSFKFNGGSQVVEAVIDQAGTLLTAKRV